MSDLQALAELVRVLREGGVSTYEGPVPDTTGPLLAKLTIRPPAPPVAARPAEEKPEQRRVPAGLHGVV